MPTTASFTSRLRPDVKQILEQVDVLVELVGRLQVDVAVRRRTDDCRPEAHGQIERRHLVHVRPDRHALQVIQQVRQRVLQFHAIVDSAQFTTDIRRCTAMSHYTYSVSTKTKPTKLKLSNSIY